MYTIFQQILLQLNRKLANGMKMWKGNGNSTTLLFSMKGLEILHQERRGQVKNGTLQRHPLPANQQHTNPSLIITIILAPYLFLTLIAANFSRLIHILVHLSS